MMAIITGRHKHWEVLMMHWEGYLQTSRGTCSQTFFGTSWHFSYGTRFLTFAQTSFGTLVQVVWGVTTFTLWHEVFPSDLAHWGMQSGWMPRLQIFSQFSRICWKQAGSYSVVYPFSHLVSSTTLHSYFSFSVKVSSQTILYSLWHSSWKVFVQDFTGILSVFLPESEAIEDDRGDSDSLVDPKNILLEFSLSFCQNPRLLKMTEVILIAWLIPKIFCCLMASLTGELFALKSLGQI